MAAGLGFKTFNTGDVLSAADTNGYLMQGVLVFASAAARDAAITSPQEGQCCYLKDTDAVLTYSGAAWVGFDDSNAIQNTIVDAKGDIVAASGSDTPARLAVGNNGETLVADSSTSTGLRYQGNYAAGKNAIINGDFSVWQRSTSATVTSETYYAPDRYRSTYVAGGATVTWSRQTFTPGAAPVAGYEGQYFSRIAATSGSGTTVIGVNQPIENVQTFAGQTATLSFWAKADSARTATILILQNFGSGGSSTVTVSNTTQAITTSWVRYSVTVSVPSISGKTIGTGSFLVPYVYFNTGQASGSPQLDLWGIQLEAGSVATAFQTATGTIQGELAACQRYYWRNTTGSTYGVLVNAAAFRTTTAVDGQVVFPVPMRINPTSMDWSAWTFRSFNGSTFTTTLAAMDANTATPLTCLVTGTVSGGTAGQFGSILSNNTTSGYIGFSAEL